MNPRSILIAGLLALSLIGCGRQEPSPPIHQVVDLTRERDRERTARVEAESARQQAESRSKVIDSLAVVGSRSGAFLLGIALGSSARRQSVQRDEW